MIKLERTDVMNIENAIRGARNPLNSWVRSNSTYCSQKNCKSDLCVGCKYITCSCYKLCENDLDLAKRLCSAGSDHRKFLRQIFVSVDITAPLYWLKEFDTYKVSTTANSTSTMHKIHSKPFELEDFSHDHLTGLGLNALSLLIDDLEAFRQCYLETKDKETWYMIIQLLPSSYNQLRTCTMNYENLRAMYHSRKNHKLDEWHVFCSWVETLPYMKEFIKCIE